MAAHGTSDDPGRGADTGLRRVAPWLVGLAAALVVMGPALAPGSLFNLDLVLTPDIPVPRGAWGLGPELPRRVPLWLPVAWLSPLIGGATAGKALMVAAITVAFVGAYRLAASRSVLAGYTAAVLYALGPFLLTRLAVGHLMIVVPMAVLPWVLTTLLDPAANLRRTFLAALALGLAGHYGGAITAVVLAVGLLATRGRGAVRVLGVALVAQLPWLVPGIVVYAEGARIVDAAPFTTYADGVDGYARLLAGHGFWNPLFQVGWPGGWPVAVAGVLLTALAWYGRAELPQATARRQLALAAVGLGIAVATAIPGVRDVYVELSRNPVGSVLREGQRAMPLFLVWLAPAAALGAQRAAHRLLDARPAATAVRGAGASVLEVLPLALAVILAFPGLWGVGGQLVPVTIPTEWEQARSRILEEPGTVVALPWYQYFNLDVDGTARRSLNPMPLYLGGDVITSSDPQLDEADRRERVDPREATVDGIVADLVDEQFVSDRLTRLGVRWVVLLHQVNWPIYTSGLNRDPGMEHVLRGPGLDLYRVRAWPGLVVDGSGAAVASRPRVEPLLDVAASGPAVVNRPAASGWLRGTAAGDAGSEGLLTVPAGDGPVWFWPSLVVLLGDAITLAALGLAVRGELRCRRDRAVRDRECAPDVVEAGKPEIAPNPL